MRILFPCGLFYPSKLGGPANTLYWLAKALVREGYDVSVVASNHHIDKGLVELDAWTKIDNIKVRYCSAKGRFPVRIVWYAAKEMKQCNIVVFSSICYLPNFPLAILARIMKKPIIWSPRGELLSSALQGNKWKLLYFRSLKCILGQHVLFHATSEEEKKSIQSVFGDKTPITIIPNFMELPPRSYRQVVNPPYFLYLGRIAPIKALDNLLKGLALSNEFNKSNFVFKIAGGVEEQFKDYYSKLKDLISQLHLEEKVYFVGPVYGREKNFFYANAHILFLVSHSENFGNVVLESLSQGTPVVASYGTPWESLEKNNAGYWIDNSPEEICKCIDKIIATSSEIYASKRIGAYNLAKQFDVFENIGQWDLSFENIKDKG